MLDLLFSYAFYVLGLTMKLTLARALNDMRCHVMFYMKHDK